MRVKCLAQEHNTMSPARARTRSARSGVERANHEATVPPRGGSGSTLSSCGFSGSLKTMAFAGAGTNLILLVVISCSNILCILCVDKAKVRPHPPVVEGDLWTARAVRILHETRP